ncbi:MAG: hypothetical protein AAF731_07675 [Bacteroidota bacterium]
MDTTKKDASGEIRVEMRMRRKVWKMADRSNDRFVNFEHQRRFEIICLVGEVLDVMTEQEWRHFVQRVQSRKELKRKEEEALKNQQNLF